MAKETQSNTNYDFSSTDLLIYIWDKKIPLLIISFIAAVASIIISLTIIPKFKSTVVLFPTTNTSISKTLLEDYYSGRKTLYEIGEEEQSEQLMQILDSEEIRDRIIEKYKLMEHYGIEEDMDFPLTRLYAEYKSNISFELTQYLSIVIEVMDTDPQFAADIANDIAKLADTVYNKILNERAMEAYNLIKREYTDLTEEVTELKDSLSKIQALGILDYESQAERYHEALGVAINEGNTSAQRNLEEKLKVLSKYGSNYVVIRDRLLRQENYLQVIRQNYEEVKLEVEQTMPHTLIVDDAVVAEKKAYPKKSIIVILSTFAAFFLTLITLMIMDSIRKKVQA